MLGFVQKFIVLPSSPTCTKPTVIGSGFSDFRSPQTKNKMMNIQKKSLQHVSEKLKSFDNHEVYRVIQKALKESGVSSEIDKVVMDAYQKGFNEQYQKVKDAKEWIDVIISDLS